MMFDTPVVIENPTPASVVALEAVVRTSEAPEMAMLAAEVLPDGSLSMGRARLIELTSRAGGSLRVTAMPDHVRISLTVLPADLDAGALAMRALIAEPEFRQDSVELAAANLPFRNRSYWDEALNPWRPNYAALGPRAGETLAEYWKAAARPERIAIAVGGGFRPGEGKAAVERAFQGWTPPKPSSRRMPVATSQPLTARRFPISTWEIEGPALTPTAPELPANIVATILLGVGKKGLLYTTVREKLGLTYRQEALLTPTPSGFAVRLILARSSSLGPLDEGVAKALEDGIGRWTDADLQRARGLLSGIEEGTFPVSPFTLSGSVPVSKGLADDTFLLAYSTQKFGKAGNWGDTLKAASTSSLEAVKAAALSIVRSPVRRKIVGA